jgi:hypothetical protein
MARAPTLALAAVPFTIARPSFGPRRTFSMFFSCRARSAVVTFPLLQPIYERGLKSPDAEILPQRGVIGTTSSCSTLNRVWIVDTRTPEAPFERVLRRMSIVARTQDADMWLLFWLSKGSTVSLCCLVRLLALAWDNGVKYMSPFRTP